MTGVIPGAGGALSKSRPGRAFASAEMNNRNCELLDDLAVPRTDSGLEQIQATTIAAPVVAIDAVYRLWQHQDALLWDPPAGMQAVAAGAAARLQATGPGRMVRLQEASRRLWRSLSPGHGTDAPAPRLWGGFSFAPGTADRGPWQDFGDASFVLPRLTYWTDGERAWLQATGTRDDTSLSRDLATASAAIAQIALDDEGSGNGETDPYGAPPCAIAPPDAAAWRQQVDDILEAIDAGQVRKVVAALCAKVTFERPPSVAGVLANLRNETGPVWRFAFTRNGATFLGATPEILVRRRAEFVESEALAGTLAKVNGTGNDLLASAKDRSEHEFVCDGIVEALAPLCSELHVPDAPSVRELRRLFHLATPVRGRLARRTHVLELCERLHPTPATCGTPRGRALDMILSTEATPRGWYAAPLGWFDAEGDGELVVALRSGLVTASAAYVHAGAGIVVGSHADKELAETELKQRVLLRALGLEPGLDF